jgi:hypothetical protein
VPDLHGTGEDQQREQHVQCAPHQVAGDHHLLPRQPVGHHPAEQHEHDHRQRVRTEHEADVGRVAGEPGDVDADGDQHEGIADGAHGLAGPEQPEVASAEQDGEHVSTVRSAASTFRQRGRWAPHVRPGDDGDVPEGDSVWKAAKRMREQLVGRTVVRSDFRVPQHATADLSGRQVTAFDSYGKHMLTRFSAAGGDDGITLHTHFEMDGAWQVVGPGKVLPRSFDDEIRLVLQTDGPTAYALRMPVLELVATATSRGCSATSGRTCSGPGWDEDEAVRRLAADPDRRSSRRCSTRRTWPASGTCGRWRPATCAATRPGRRSATWTCARRCSWPAG